MVRDGEGKRVTLTATAVEAGLYCTSPTGRAQLVAHLEQRGYRFDGETLARAVAALGEKVSVVEIEVGGVRVSLWCLRGTRVG